MREVNPAPVIKFGKVEEILDVPNLVDLQTRSYADFLQSEIQEVSERNLAGYAQLSFGSDDPLFGNVRVEGNIGVRYVNTRLESLGSISVPSATALGVQDPFAVRCAPTPPPPPAPQVPGVPGGVCRLGEAGYNALQTWAGAGSTTPDLAENTYDYFLPSLNVKFELNNELPARNCCPEL